MKLFYRTTIALSIFLVVAFLTAGPAAALEPIGNVMELPIADCGYTVSGDTISIDGTALSIADCSYTVSGYLEFSKDGEYVDDEIIGVDSTETGAQPEPIVNP